MPLDLPVKVRSWELTVYPRMIPIGNSAPISIVRRAPPTASCSWVSPQRKRTKPSPSLFRSTEERRSPGSCSSFRSREQPHAGITTVVLGCRTWATLGSAASRFLAWRASVLSNRSRSGEGGPTCWICTRRCHMEGPAWDLVVRSLRTGALASLAPPSSRHRPPRRGVPTNALRRRSRSARGGGGE
jgi:hypothetical protein